MWKRWAIRIAAHFIEKLFDKWMRHKNPEETLIIDELLESFAKYMRSHSSPTHQLISQILEDWRE